VERSAQDGATMADVRFQISHAEPRPTLAVLSVGGNDVIQHVGLLEARSATATEVLEQLLQIADNFECEYEAVVRTLTAKTDQLVVCTIYEVQLEPRRSAQLARVPLGVLNDRIVRVASRLGVSVLDLRSVCTDPSDFVRQIEPSARGAAKIARAIAGVALGGVGLTSSVVFAA
jgi:hypothetical protein